MLGLILIYFVGKAFYDLAGKYNKSQWGFGILGVVSYYAGLIIGGSLLGVVIEFISPGFIDDTSETLLAVMALPLGVLTCWLTYVLLKRAWSQPKEISRNTLDADLIATSEPDRYKKGER